MDEETLDLLARVALFDGLERAEIRALCAALGCRRAAYPRGSVLIKRGEHAEQAGVVLCGAVRAERNGADGALRVVAQHGAGALFGDMLAASRGRHSPVDVVAAEDTEVLYLPLRALMRGGAAEQRAPWERVRLNLLGELAEKYWALNERAAMLCAPTLRAKLARRLLAERRAVGRDAFALPGTRETLAAELGANRSALSRVLGEMAREGILRARRDHFVLLDVPALERLAEE